MIIPKSRAAVSAGVAVAALVSAVAAPAMAGSFYLQEQSARGAGRAYSGEGADRGVASMWWNSAAIARSGREASVGLHGLLLRSTVENAGSSITYPGGITAPVRGLDRANDPIESGLAPNFAVATPIGDRFAVGLSIAAPYNFTTKYAPASFARYDALTSELRTVDAGLTAAMQVTDWLDVGVGLDAQHVDAKLTSALPNLSPALPDGHSSLEGDGWDFGWNAGAQAHFGKLDLGLSYRSSIEHELDGDIAISGLLGPLAGANVESEGVAAFNTPWFATVSARYAVNDRLTLNAQVNRIGWSEFDAIRVSYPTGGDTIAQNYTDVTTGAVGFDYQATDRVTVRGGVGYDPTPTRDDERTARIPDADRWLFSAGSSIKASESATIDLGLTYIAFSDTEIHSDRTFYSGTPAATTSHLRGDVTGYGVVASAGVRWAF
ncbi:OmpP1/FadL family transporter [Brevundimonas sp. Root1279]|uniref:OmpP1/FadL family transporter n=1 Tax=Brevundimonas sp. Root1279 TaxID=1736443 RepID=UPI0006F8E9A9|nr:outer membrane protein transport protein [Brevundimonas sp. Root1279]KQW82352.1 long-chain fatty acid transporter [Brevundimonas sp. Root1279]